MGKSCQSILNMDGVCVITSAKTLSACQKFGNGAFWYNNSLCVNQTANDPASCTQVTVDTLIFCRLLDVIKIF